MVYKLNQMANVNLYNQPVYSNDVKTTKLFTLFFVNVWVKMFFENKNMKILRGFYYLLGR